MEDKLINCKDSQLFDVVKNYKKYNYTEDIKIQAIKILQERGYSIEYLQNNNLLENKERAEALRFFSEYNYRGKISLCLYISIFIFRILSSLFDNDLFIILSFVVFILSIIGIIMSYKSLLNCYKHIQGKEIPFNIFFIFTWGVVFFFIFFFYFKSVIIRDIDEMD